MNKEVFDFICRTAEDFDIKVRPADENQCICLGLPNDLEFFIECDTITNCVKDCVEEFEIFDDNLCDYINCFENDLDTYRFDSTAERIEMFGVAKVLREFRNQLANDFEYDFS